MGQRFVAALFIAFSLIFSTSFAFASAQAATTVSAQENKPNSGKSKPTSPLQPSSTIQPQVEEGPAPAPITFDQLPKRDLGPQDAYPLQAEERSSIIPMALFGAVLLGIGAMVWGHAAVGRATRARSRA